MITMTDIAKECGVSQTLVSLVLNKRDQTVGISQKTREKVLKTAEKMGYCRNEMAVSVVKRQSKILAFVSGDMGTVEYSGRIQNGIFAEANLHDYAVNVFHLSKCNIKAIAEKIIGWMTAGVIFHVADMKQVAKLCTVLKKNKIPYGFSNLSNPKGIGVTTDDYQGAKTAVKYLADHGSQKILFISHKSKGSEYLQKRTAGYLDGMKEYLPDAKPDSVLLDNSLDPDVVTQLRILLKKKRPDAVFCVGDDIAMRVETAILSMNLRIPEDIAVIGYGNLQMGQYAPIPLTTVDQDYEAMGRLVVQAVLSQKETEQNQYLPVKLLIRESTQKKEKKNEKKFHPDRTTRCDRNHCNSPNSVKESV